MWICNCLNPKSGGCPDELQNAIGTRLNKHYDVIVESDHIHIEYQPRRS